MTVWRERAAADRRIRVAAVVAALLGTGLALAPLIGFLTADDDDTPLRAAGIAEVRDLDGDLVALTNDYRFPDAASPSTVSATESLGLAAGYGPDGRVLPTPTPAPTPEPTADPAEDADGSAEGGVGAGAGEDDGLDGEADGGTAGESEELIDPRSLLPPTPTPATTAPDGTSDETSDDASDSASNDTSDDDEGLNE